MTGEHPNTATGHDRPHSNRLVGFVRGGEHVRAVGMPSNCRDAGVVTHQDALGGCVILHEYTDGLVPAGCSKVVAMGAPEHPEDGSLVRLVDAQTSPRVQGPQADLAICRRR